MEEREQMLHAAIDAELEALAARLSPAPEQPSPVENAVQLEGRGHLGILLTDAEERVLGRVWVAFEPTQDGLARASVCSEVISPPLALEAWAQDHGGL
jgi:hypothetical protein